MNNIEITVKVNGKEVPLSDISTETFEKIKKAGVDPIEEYCRKNEFYLDEYARLIKFKDMELVEVSLPHANGSWTFAAFDFIKNFCKVFPKCFPVHGLEYTPGVSRKLYIRIRR